jgi:cell division protein WhiA
VSDFSLNVRNELAVNAPEKECCQRSLLTALLLSQALLEIRSDGVQVCVLETWSGPCARLVLRLVRRFESPPVTWEARRIRRLQEAVCYTISLGPAPRLPRFLSHLGFVLPDAGSGPLGYEYTSVKRRCCKRAFLRGFFLAGGSVAQPHRGYHLEWVVRNAAGAQVLEDLTAELELPCRARRRGRRVIFYLKGSNDIARALNLMGAYRGLLRFEEVRAVKETKNQVHRRVNCDTANLARSSRAAVRQVAAVEFLRSRVGLSRLPPDLQGLARARLRLPDASYGELGGQLRPVLARVAVGRRLGRLERMAAELGHQAPRLEGSGSTNDG